MELTESTAKQELPACPVETTLTLISDKWKVLILRDRTAPCVSAN